MLFATRYDALEAWKRHLFIWKWLRDTQIPDTPNPCQVSWEDLAFKIQVSVRLNCMKWPWNKPRKIGRRQVYTTSKQSFFKYLPNWIQYNAYLHRLTRTSPSEINSKLYEHWTVRSGTHWNRVNWTSTMPWWHRPCEIYKLPSQLWARFWREVKAHMRSGYRWCDYQYKHCAV